MDGGQFIARARLKRIPRDFDLWLPSAKRQAYTRSPCLHCLLVPLRLLHTTRTYHLLINRGSGPPLSTKTRPLTHSPTHSTSSNPQTRAIYTHIPPHDFFSLPHPPTPPSHPHWPQHCGLTLLLTLPPPPPPPPPPPSPTSFSNPDSTPFAPFLLSCAYRPSWHEVDRELLLAAA